MEGVLDRRVAGAEHDAELGGGIGARAHPQIDGRRQAQRQRARRSGVKTVAGLELHALSEWPAGGEHDTLNKNHVSRQLGPTHPVQWNAQLGAGLQPPVLRNTVVPLELGPTLGLLQETLADADQRVARRNGDREFVRRPR